MSKGLGGASKRVGREPRARGGVKGKLGRLAAGLCSLVAGVAAGNQVGCSKPIECAAVQDCAGKAPVCQTAMACEQGACVFVGSAEGIPSAEQTAGDCQQAVCDGSGGVKLVPLIEDVPDDKNICTLDTCAGSAPKHTLQPEAACKTGLSGVCTEGVQRCDAEGKPVGGCMGAAPTAERCDAEELDEDCDGEVNEEGSDCSCGDGWVSKGETCDDGGTTDNDGCSAVCEAQQVLQVVAGNLHTCARLSAGVVKCWGYNDFGLLGLGDTAIRGGLPGEMGDKLLAVNLGTGGTAQAIAAGTLHTCALLSDGSVKCWGNNAYGQLGQGDIAHRGDKPDEMGDKLLAVNLGAGRKAQAIAAGAAHTCALLSDGSVKCWGSNGGGQLGLGDPATRGDGPGEMGDKLLAVNLGTGRTAQAIAAGDNHTCVLLSDGSVKCWGSNGSGQLGLGDTAVRGDGPDEMGDKLLAVDLGTGRKAQAIAAGGSHTCALLDDGSVKCWGLNELGQLGQGDKATRGDAPGAMGDKLLAVNLGAGRKAQAIAAGASHTCAVLDDGSVKCWGDNKIGQLGQGDTDNRGDGPDEIGDKLLAVNLGAGRKAQATAAGGRHTCALLDDSSMKCWGDNYYGQLGQGDTDNRGDDADELGDKLPTVKLYTDTW